MSNENEPPKMPPGGPSGQGEPPGLQEGDTAGEAAGDPAHDPNVDETGDSTGDTLTDQGFPIPAGDEESWGLPNEFPDRHLTDPKPDDEKPYVLPIYVYTAVFGAIFIIGPLLVRRGPNAGIARCCIMMSAFCCWIFWTTTYLVQMHPLLGPRMDNTTLAWIGHKWGKNPVDCPDHSGLNVIPPPPETNEGGGEKGTEGGDKTGEDKTGEDKTGEDKTGEDKTGEDDKRRMDAKGAPGELLFSEQKMRESLNSPLKPKDPADEHSSKLEPKDPPEEQSQDEISRRRFNGTDLFTNLTHLIRE